MTRTFPTKDPKEAQLRGQWHAAKAAFDKDPSASNAAAFKHASSTLADYIWGRMSKEIEEDRRKHPKAKRNQPKPFGATPSGNRCLP